MENLILILILISFLAYLLSLFLKEKPLPFIGSAFLFLGLLGSLYLIGRFFEQTKRLPLTNTSETLIILTTIIIMLYLVLEYKIHMPQVAGLVTSSISFLGLYSAFYIFKKPLIPLLPALQSKWLLFHVSSCITAYAFFGIAFIVGLIYIFKRVPELKIFSVMHRAICVGFLFLTFGIILGSIWGKFAWGHWWNWDPKETWALITWLIYLGYIHGKVFWNWQKKRLAWIAMVGFLACLFTYFGVNFLLKGLHSYG